MPLAPILETGVIDQIGTSVLCGDDGVMALWALRVVLPCLVAPFAIGTEDVHTAVAVVLAGTEVQQVAWQDGFVAIGIDIGTVGLLRTEHAHLIATVVIVVGDTAGSQSAIGHKQEVIAADILDIRGLAWGIVATGNLLAEVGVDGDAVALAHQLIVDVVVAQACLLVEFEHPDATAPRAVRHPEFAFFVVEHAGVDVVRIALAPFVAHVVAFWQRGLFANDDLQVGILVTCTVLESADHHGCLISVGTLDVVGSQQDDAREPGVAIDTHVHAPLLHRLVVDHIGCPQVAADIVAAVATLRPGLGIKVEVILLPALLHFRDGWRRKGYVVGSIVVAACFPGGSKFRPVHQILGLRRSTVRSKDVIGLRVRLPHDTGIVDADALQRVGCNTDGQQRKEQKDQIFLHNLVCFSHILFWCKGTKKNWNRQVFCYIFIVCVK